MKSMWDRLDRGMRRAFPVVLSCLLCSCTSSRLTRYDYAPSLQAYAGNSTKKALAEFPRGEAGGFITDLEKAHLYFLEGTSSVARLRPHADLMNDRLEIDVSEELGSFFYGESQEGYFAAEHEIIWMHFLLGAGYCLDKNYEAAGVEARIGSSLLERAEEGDPGLDTSMLRVFLACLWTACDSWEEARVDFRVAQERNPALDWCKTLAERHTPPRHLALVYGGIGPEPKWTPSFCLNIARGLRDITFISPGRKSPGTLAESSGRQIPVYLTPDSLSWYKRHQIRNLLIHELVNDSRYSCVVAKTTLSQSLKFVSGVTYGTVVGSVITAAGLGIAYLAAESGEGEAFLGGLVIAIAGPLYAFDISYRTYQDCISDIQEDLNTADSYRFARFLPEYAWIGFSDENIQYPLRFSVPDGTISNIFPVISRENVSISVIQCADVNRKEIQVSSMDQMWKDWRRAFLHALLKHPLNGPDGNGLKNMVSAMERQTGSWRTKERRCSITTTTMGESGIRWPLLYLEIERGLFKSNQEIMVDFTAKTVEKQSEAIYLFLEESPETLADKAAREIEAMHRLHLQKLTEKQADK